MLGTLREYASGTPLSLRQVARAWNVLLSTLQKRATQGMEHLHAPSKRTILSKAQEDDVAGLLLKLTQRRFPVTTAVVRKSGIPLCTRE